MCVTETSGLILDCNGAALTLLFAKGREELCNGSRTVLDLIADEQGGLGTQGLWRIDGGTEVEALGQSLRARPYPKMISLALAGPIVPVTLSIPSHTPDLALILALNP